MKDAPLPIASEFCLVKCLGVSDRYWFLMGLSMYYYLTLCQGILLREKVDLTFRRSLQTLTSVA